ncbi:alpha/beta hydrolase [bacterium LRH843]|nr:alpha/beta hydrolase [bacterium LRH843]
MIVENKEAKEITYHIERIRSFKPTFGTHYDVLKDQVDEYRKYYNLHIPKCDYDYGYIHAIEEQLFVQRFRPAKKIGTVLLLHGYYDHAGSLSHTIHYLTQHGYEVVCFDLIGHGLSSGERATIQSFSQYVNSLAVVRKEIIGDQTEPVHFVGHSTGAMIGLEYTQNHSNAFDKMVFIAPLYRPHLWPISGLALKIGKSYMRSIKRIFKRNSSDQSYLSFTKSDPLQEKIVPIQWLCALDEVIRQQKKQGVSSLSFLMIQGEQDKTVDRAYGLEFAMRLYPDSSFILMKDGRHQLLNEEPIVRGQTLSIIIKYLNSGTRIDHL